MNSGSLSGGRGLVITPGRLAANVPIVLAFEKDELSQPLPVQLFELELENDGLPSDRLLLWVPHAGEEGMGEALLKRDAIVRVEDQNFFEEVDSLWWGARVFLLQVGPWIGCELLQVL